MIQAITGVTSPSQASVLSNTHSSIGSPGDTTASSYNDERLQFKGLFAKMEVYHPLGTIVEYLSTKTDDPWGFFTDAIHLILQVCAEVLMMMNAGIEHGDLHCRNVVVGTDTDCNIYAMLDDFTCEHNLDGRDEDSNRPVSPSMRVILSQLSIIPFLTDSISLSFQVVRLGWILADVTNLFMGGTAAVVDDSFSNDSIPADWCDDNFLEGKNLPPKLLAILKPQFFSVARRAISESIVLQVVRDELASILTELEASTAPPVLASPTTSIIRVSDQMDAPSCCTLM